MYNLRIKLFLRMKSWLRFIYTVFLIKVLEKEKMFLLFKKDLLFYIIVYALKGSAIKPKQYFYDYNGAN